MKQDACTVELVPFAAIDPPALVALINDAYLRYKILSAPRISLADFLDEAGPDSDFLIARAGGHTVGCAMVYPADRFFAAAAANGTRHGSGSIEAAGAEPPAEAPCTPDPQSTLPFAGDLADALYFGLAAVRRGAQGFGVGQQLVANAEAVARKRGAARIVLTTLREFGLIDYYARFGYHLVGTEAYPAGHWAVTVPHTFCYMEKRL